LKSQETRTQRLSIPIEKSGWGRGNMRGEIFLELLRWLETAQAKQALGRRGRVGYPVGRASPPRKSRAGDNLLRTKHTSPSGFPEQTVAPKPEGCAP